MFQPPLALPPASRPPLTCEVSDAWLAWLNTMIEQSEQNCRVLAVMRGDSLDACRIP